MSVCLYCFQVYLEILIFTLKVKAQTSPNAFNYSAVARNSFGQPIATTTLGIQVSILKTSPAGTSQYSENHFVNTDAFGLFNLVIGTGSLQSGNMNTIDWSNDNYYLKDDMDTSGGTNFLTMVTSQLLSVPYALYAKSAGSIINGGSNGSFTHYIGEQFGGGIIFQLWKDAQGVEHGLIVDLTDLSTNMIWSNIDSTFIGFSAQNHWNGLGNSNAIVSQVGHNNSAAALCLNSTNGGQSDWYLPSIQEIKMLWNNYYTVVRSLSQISGATALQPTEYWCSKESESYPDSGYYFCFYKGWNGSNGITTKSFTKSVRAVRAF
jgi:hypothetical protein